MALLQPNGDLQLDIGGFNMHAFVNRGVNTHNMDNSGIVCLFSRHPRASDTDNPTYSVGLRLS